MLMCSDVSPHQKWVERWKRSAAGKPTRITEEFPYTTIEFDNIQGEITGVDLFDEVDCGLKAIGIYLRFSNGTRYPAKRIFAWDGNDKVLNEYFKLGAVHDYRVSTWI